MNDPTHELAAPRMATLTLTSSSPDDLSMEVTYDGATGDDTGIDRTNVAHNLIDHFAQQLIAGADQLKARAAEAERPRIVLAGATHV